MNNSENYPNPGAPDQELLRELMPKLGMEATEPKSRYKNRLRLRFLLPKVLVLCALAAALFFVVSYGLTPSQVRDVQMSGSPEQAEAVFNVDRVLLLESVTARLNGMLVAVENQSVGSYKISVDKNGTLVINTRTFTGRESQTELTVDCIDEEPPHISSHKLADGVMTICFTDNGGAGIDWQTLQATDMVTGESFDVAQIDEQNDLIRFTFPNDSIRFTLSDCNGNPLAVVLEMVPSGGENQPDTAAGESAP